MFPARFVSTGVAREFLGPDDHLPRDEPQHRRRQKLLGRPGTPGMSEQTQLHREAETIRVGAMPPHEIEIGRGERVELGNLMRLGRQREQLFALSGREKVAAPGDRHGTGEHHSNAARLAYSIAQIGG